MILQADGFTGVWEVAKGVMLTLTTMGVGWTARLVFTLRDDVRALNHAVGTDGTNGLIAARKRTEKRLDAIDDRHLKEDTVTEIELELSEGKRRRLRDRVLPDDQESQS